VQRTDAEGHDPTLALQQWAVLFNDLVGDGEQ
jgi:hypothetical protein